MESQISVYFFLNRHHPSAIGPSGHSGRHHHHHHHHERRGLPAAGDEPLTHISGRRRNRPASFTEESVDPVRDREEQQHHRSKGVRFDSAACGQSSHTKYRKTQL